MDSLRSVAYLQSTIGNKAVGDMLTRRTPRPALQAKRLPISEGASGTIQMRKINTTFAEDGSPVSFNTEDFDHDLLQRVQQMLSFYDEAAASALASAIENKEYMGIGAGMGTSAMDEEEEDGEFFPLTEQLEHFESAVLPDITEAQTRIASGKGPQSLTKFQGNVFEQTTMFDAEVEETKAISTNAFHMNFSGVDFMMGAQGGPFGQDKSHISGDMEDMVAAYIAEYTNRYNNAQKMLSKMMKAGTKTTENMLKALNEAATFDDEGIAQQVVDAVMEIHKHNKGVEETGAGEWISEPDDKLVEAVGNHMLFTVPYDVYEYLPGDIQHAFLPSSTTSMQLQHINQRSLELGLTKAPKPKGSKETDPDYDGSDS